MGVKRLLLIAVFVLAASVAIVPGATADDFADEPCPDASGPNTALCPSGRVAVPYSLQFKLADGSGCGPDLTTWRVSSGNFPPGLSINSGSGLVTGTPTQAGNFKFFLTVSYPVLTNPPCNGGFSDHEFTIPILPEIPRLILQPEQSAVPISTIGSPFQLQMTSNLADAKAWSIVSGQLPPGLTLGTTDGLISGTPTTEGDYPFTVNAVLTSDTLQNPPRSDQKQLQITVRRAVAITAGEPFVAGKPTKWEVSVPFDATLTAAGGTGTFTWALGAGTTLPAGLVLGTTDGTISGTPRRAGVSRFSVTATDAEGRVATFTSTLNIAAKLAVVAQPLPAGKVGKRYKTKLKTTGGVAPVSWKIKTGPLPRGIRLDRTLGVLAGTPTKAGRYRITVEATDEVGVKSTRSFTIIVLAAPQK